MVVTLPPTLQWAWRAEHPTKDNYSWILRSNIICLALTCLEPIIPFFLSNFSLLEQKCLSTLFLPYYSIFEAHNLSGFNGSLLKKNSDSGCIIFQVSPIPDLCGILMRFWTQNWCSIKTLGAAGMGWMHLYIVRSWILGGQRTECYGLNLSPQNFYVEGLTPNVMASGYRAFTKVIS